MKLGVFLLNAEVFYTNYIVWLNIIYTFKPGILKSLGVQIY